MQNLSAADRKIVQRQLVQLPPRTKAAQEKEMGEMMGKLKEVSSTSSSFGTTSLRLVVWKQDIESIRSIDRPIPDGKR